MNCEIKPVSGTVFYWIPEAATGEGQAPVHTGPQKLTRSCESAASEEGRLLGPGLVLKVTSVIKATP
jgi:hypothetical protein